MSDYQPYAQQPYQSVPPPEPKKSRTWLWVLLGGGLLGLLLIGLGGVLLATNLLGRQSAIPQLVGADTQFYATIQPSLSDLPNVQKLQEAYPELFVDKDPSSADKQLEETLGVKFKEDVQPWIGREMAIAVSGLKDFTLEGGSLSGDAANELARQAKVTIILASRDDSKAQEFLDKQRAARSDKGQSFDESEHGGIKIFQQRDGDSSPIAAFALVRSNVVFATSKDVIEAMIDRDGDGEDTLQKNPRYAALRGQLPETAVGHVFVDGNILSTMSTSVLEQSLDSLPPEQSSQLEEQLATVRALQGLGLSISIAAEGVQFDTAMTFDLNKLSGKAKEQIEATREPVDGERLKAISRDAIGLLTFKIPSTFKEQVLSAIRAQENGEETLQQFEEQVGFNLETDLLDWFQGDASLVILPGDKIGDVTLPATGYFAIKPKDRGAAEAGMEKIAAAIEKLAGGESFSFQEEEVGGATWQVVKDPSSDTSVAGYGFVKDDLVIGFGMSALGSAGSGGTSPITDNDDFKTIQGKLATTNGGILFVHVGNALRAAEDAGVNLDELNDGQTAKSLRPIKAIGAAGEPGINADGVAKSRLFVVISK